MTAWTCLHRKGVHRVVTPEPRRGHDRVERKLDDVVVVEVVPEVRDVQAEKPWPPTPVDVAPRPGWDTEVRTPTPTPR